MMLTLRETMEQYEALNRSIAQFEAVKDDLRAYAPERRVCFLGCGSSYMIACALRDITAAKTGLYAAALPAGDLLINAPQYRDMLEDTLLVCISRSGQTSELVLAAEWAKKNVHAHVLSIVCGQDSPLEACSDAALVLPWAFDESVCQTRCVSNMFAVGALLIDLWQNKDGNSSVMADLQRLTQLGKDYLEEIADPLNNMALMDWKKVVVLADGIASGLADEGALAFVEIAQCPSNRYHLLDSRHGPMVLFDETTLVIAWLHGDTKAYENGLLADVMKKGSKVITFSTHHGISGEVRCVEDKEKLEIEVGCKLCEEAQALLFLNICQLVSYYKSTVQGNDPDKPTGLSPWIKL